MANSNRRRRTNIVVNKEIQSRIIMSVAWLPATALIITTVLVGTFCSALNAEAIEADIELPALIPLFITVAAYLVIAGLLIGLNALRFSHRVAGPMYRIKKTLETVLDGDESCRANLRKGDFLTEVAEDLNRFLDAKQAQHGTPAPTPATDDAPTEPAATEELAGSLGGD